jgi:hypothetical protein
MKNSNLSSKNKRPHKKHPKKRAVNLSTKDIEELMGIHRDIYRKVNGAWRRK